MPETPNSTTPTPFRGRITLHHSAHSEFDGAPPVLIPEDADDVAAALTIVRDADRNAYVRSGELMASASRITDEAAAVVSLEELNDVTIHLQRITLGPAATVGDLTRALKPRSLFVPMPDRPSASIAGIVLGEHRPPFPLSMGKQRLHDGVIAASILRDDGIHRLDSTEWSAFRASPDGILLELTIDASIWARYAANRWVRVWVLPYSLQTFRGIADAVFGGPRPSDTDFSVRVSTGSYGARLILVRATGQNRDRSEGARQLVESAITSVGTEVLRSRSFDGAGAAQSAWVATGPARCVPGEVVDRLASEKDWAGDGEDAFYAEADELVRCGAWVELHAGSMYRRAYVPAGPPLPPSAILQPMIQGSRTVVTRLLDSLATLIQPNNAVAIPGFAGEVYRASNNSRAYRAATRQYATSSYDQHVIASRMTPGVIVVPTDSNDVAVAVQYAVQQNLKVVARSGGHQYCGLSSGGAQTLVIDLQLLRGVDFLHAPLRVKVGPGTTLECLSTALANHNVAIPHGECPLVNLGGHVQTGGVGHQLRSLGLALDWVRAFTMVDATGQESEYVLPTANTSPLNNSVFSAVLGGGPGSWGVLTSITFEVVPDDAHAGSVGITRTYPYNRSGWAAAFDAMMDWTTREAAGSLPAGVDFFLSVISEDDTWDGEVNYRPAVVLVETSALNASDAHVIRATVDGIEQHVSWVNRQAGTVIDLASGNLNGPADLSEIVDKGVRSTGIIGGMPNGREFTLPYRKSLYLSRLPLTQAFCDDFVDLVNRVNGDSGTKVVFQGVIGGGRFRDNGNSNTTRMQRRDALIQIVFDVFYERGYEDQAIAYQEEMRKMWEHHFPTESIRMFWGTFEDEGTQGEQLDMSQPSTQGFYYNSPAEYVALQSVKHAIDPTDVFSTSFTVK